MWFPVLSILILVFPALGGESGCDMTPGSPLRACLGAYASLPPTLPAETTSAPEQLASYCTQYQQIADCWAQGLYCREWLPLQIEADKFCQLASAASSAFSTGTITSVQNASQTITTFIAPTSLSSGENSNSVPTVNGSTLSTGTSSSTPQPTLSPVPTVLNITKTITLPATVIDESLLASATNAFDSVQSEASNVVASIWNDDSGTDIPVVSNNVGTKTEPTWTHVGETGPTGTAAIATSAKSTATGSIGASDSSPGSATGTGTKQTARLLLLWGWCVGFVVRRLL